MNFQNLVYSYSKIMAFYGTNNRLPNTVSVKAGTTTITEGTTTKPTNGYSPYNVVVTTQYVSATAKCSCGSGTYTYKTSTFLNYCPQCGHYGTLIKSTKTPEYEGQWTCTYCDCDYCMQCGNEKLVGTKLWLKPCII
jgi:N-acetylmuramoyl-L-alanine amidase